MNPDHFLGIQGMTIGDAGVWTLVVVAIGAAVRQWIVGIADRRRALNEEIDVKEKADHDKETLLFEQMQKQMSRMESEIDVLKQRINHLEDQARAQAERERILLEENTLLRIDSALKTKLSG